MSFSIGTLVFDDLRGSPDLPQMRRDVEAKTGDDGVSIFNTGRRGMAFEFETRRAFGTYALARTAEITYTNTFTAAPVNVTIGAVTFPGVSFVVLGVKTRIEAMPLYESSLTGVVSPAFVLFAVWQLQAVE